MTEDTRPPVFTSHPREYLAAADQAFGVELRQILSDDRVDISARIDRALYALIEHIAETKVILGAADHEDEQGDA